MNLNYLAFVIPFFLLFCILEYYLSLKKEKKVFRFSETISNLNIGIFERTCDLFATATFHFYFVWLYNKFSIFDIKANVTTWILLFLATDLLWYWYHRFGHQVNILWSAHVVHHQSEDFNFTVAARITLFQAFFRSLFWSFIPILGFPPEMITVILLIHGAYPFFTHTQLIGKLGFLERILVTPSHHRVHHSSNEKYLDKNFGDVLIIWDKIFGTFVEEDEKEKIVYGVTDPINSYSFLWQHFHYLMELFITIKRSKSWAKKLRILFAPPESIDPTIRRILEKKFLTTSNKKEISSTLSQIIIINTLITIVFIFFYLLFGFYQNGYEIFLGSLFVLLSVIHTGAMLEQKRWLFHIEFSRVIAFSLYIAQLIPTYWFIIPALSVIGILTLFYRTISKQYLKALTIEPRMT